MVNQQNQRFHRLCRVFRARIMTRNPLSLVAAGVAALSLAASPAQSETNVGQVAMHVAYMLQSHH